jgi:hypothetical protein
MSQDLSRPSMSLQSRLERLQSTASEKRPSIVEAPKTLFLPGLGEFSRAMPNHIARSSLFSPVARGRKALHRDVVLVSRSDAVITYSGEQLDESQADVWMQMMHEALKYPLGDLVPINRAKFLRAIGRHTGRYEYAWLHRTMKALSFAMLVVEAAKDGKPKLSVSRTRVLHMIDGFEYDDELEEYSVRINPRWCGLYANKEYALIDWERRLRIRQGQDMAKSLQRLVATTSDTVQRYQLSWLKEKLQYSSPMRKFKGALINAMRELERVEVIAGGRIELSTKGKQQATWHKVVDHLPGRWGSIPPVSG